MKKYDERPYVRILKESLTNRNLSFKARGLLTYLVGLPDDWVVNLNHLIGAGKDGRDSVRSAISELIEEGYINKVVQRDGHGRIVGKTFMVFERREDNPRLPLPKSGLPKSGKPTLVNRPLLKKDYTKDRSILKKDNTNNDPNPILGLGSVDPSFFDDYWKNCHQTTTNPKRDNATETQSQEDVPY